MIEKMNHSGQAATLRQRAEDAYRRDAARLLENVVAKTSDEVQQMLHELRVHQIELEMQNEELRRTQSELVAARARYFDLYDLAPVGYCTVSDKGLIIEANLTAVTLLGVARNALVKRQLADFIFPEDQDIYYRHCRLLFQTGSPQVYELRLMKKDAAAFWVRIDSVLAKDTDGVPICRATMIDIADRKRSEEMQRKSEEKTLEILNSISDAFMSLDDNMVVKFFNPAAERMLNRKASDVLGHRLFDSFPEARGSVFEINYAQCIRTKTACSFEVGFTVSPYTNWYDVRVYPEKDGIAVFFQVITERKKAEEKIKASLLEKETMLKEIHHRVKNNLQVISSLLNMQSALLPDEDEASRKMFQDSMARVKTMAMIHSQLYQSQDLARVDFGPFIRDLIGNINQSSGRALLPVEIKVDANDIHLDIDTSIPCGLILNELVANALKHAFPEGKEGEIGISMKRAASQCVLKIGDNGIGFPGEIDFRNTQSLGLELVNLLVGQMDGTIDMQVDGGTTWTITFPIKNEME
jgi:PAS domain S-box-containing protein